MTTTAPSPPAVRSPWLGLAVLCLPALMASMDTSVLLFAIPDLARDLHADATAQLWMLDVYGFVLASLLLTMGALGDRIGRRRLLMIGAVAFSAASLAATWAGGPVILILARALMGVGGATLMPSTLALIRSLFDNPSHRSRAVAVWTGVLVGGVAVGPVISGVLLAHFWWGSVFLINVPVMAAFLAVAPWLLPESRSTLPGPIDLPSAAISLVGILAAVYGIKQLAAHGWHWDAAAALVVGVAFGAAFVRRQRHLAHPLLDLGVFRTPGVAATVAVNSIAQFALLGNAVLLTAYLQSVLGMTPLRAALYSLVPTVVVSAAVPFAPGLAERFSRPAVMAAGLLCGAAGFGGLLLVGARSSVWLLMAPAGVLAVGVVVVATLAADHILAVAPPDRAAATSAVVETSSELSGALGMGVLGSLVTAGYRWHLSGATPPAGTHPRDTQALRAGIAEALARADGAGPTPAVGSWIADTARAAYVSGMHVAAIAAAVLLVAGAVALRAHLRGR